jgi:hypothetical protein
MKINFLTLFSLIVSVLVLTTGGLAQRQGWKGEILPKDNVKIMKNPDEPLFGEINLELEEDLSIGNEEDENYLFFRTWYLDVDGEGNIYVADGGNTRIQVFDRQGKFLRTIGRKGEGPGEFNHPNTVFVSDLKKEVYVPDFRSIVVFNFDGRYERTIPLQSPNRIYCVSSGGVIVGEVDKVEFDERNIAQTRKYFASLRFLDAEDGSETPIASYPDQISKIIDGGVGKFSHGYEHTFQVCSLGPDSFVYGFSSDYDLHVIDSAGNTLRRIQKESALLPISHKEKDAVKERFRDAPIKNLDHIPFPKHKPHFDRIFADSDRIFVFAHKSPSDDSNVLQVDIFDSQGYYLYKATLPIIPKLIKNGFLYRIDSSDETGEVRVKRYRIENWDNILK